METVLHQDDMDKECIALCTKLNALGDIQTYESCCGHLKGRYMVFFKCHSFERLAKLYRCICRNYSDGKWEVLVDGNDVHPTYCFCLRSKEPFASYEEMEESVQMLIKNINYWEDHAYDDHFGGDKNKNIVEGYLVETDTKYIDGHCQLELVVGDKYEIHCGIHEGLFEYVGKVSKDDPINIHSRGIHLFRNLEKNEITFGYYGITSPYEFTGIVKHRKDLNKKNLNMNIGLSILLLYITPMLLCLSIGIVVNWKDIRTVGDLLFPLFIKENRGANVIIYVPIVNIITLSTIIILGIQSFLKQLFCEWTPISKYVSKFLNTKIK